jgi:demethylmenaquinone methyltransferase/2-methoxy-6-polyprenyl-1,4-benzoquinol methylase
METIAPVKDPGFESEEAKKRKKYMVDLFVVQAKNYDFHDDIYGLYAHRLWVRTMVKIIEKFMKNRKRADMLDMGCGTGFVTFNVARKLPAVDNIESFDLSPDMIKVAKERYEKGFKGRKIKFWVADAEVPFGQNKYDIVTTSFAYRNFANKHLATKNVFNALKPGGIFIIQDLTKPEKHPMKGLYAFYMKFILPIFAKILGTEKSAAGWLKKSTDMMPTNAQIQKILEGSGMVKCYHKSLSGGIACIIVGFKPEV